MLVMPDHPTPISIRTNTADDVPYLLYDSTKIESNAWKYNEKEAAQSGNRIAKGCEMIDYLIGKQKNPAKVLRSVFRQQYLFVGNILAIEKQIYYYVVLWKTCQYYGKIEKQRVKHNAEDDISQEVYKLI